MNKLDKYVGNKRIFDKLIFNFNQKKLSNSLIFCGPKGIGKSTLALFLIKNIYENILKKKSNNNDINLLYNNTHPNIRYVDKKFDSKLDKFKTSITIDQIRELDNFLNQYSLNELPKFIIIDSADDLNNNAANALLKSLEEPKKNNYFILIAHQISNILPTIRSRCIKLYIPKPNFDDFSIILSEFYNDLDLEKINFLYNISNSSPGLALDLCSDKINDIFDNIITILSNKDPLSTDVINFSNHISKFNNDEFKIFIFLIRFILISITKINLGNELFDNADSKLSRDINHVANKINNQISLKILEYLNTNENDLFIYNLDKKIFSLNIFSNLNTSNE